ncbi:MAG: response regulator transcription factor, partial [Nitrospiria bacterium]
NGVSPGTWPLIESLCLTVKVMMLFKDYHPPTVARALESGVTGILTEEGSGGETIFKAIHEVAAGSVWCEPSPTGTGPPLPKPSEREGEVMELIRRGLSNRDIADRLCISERTVKSHVNRLLQKFQLKNRVQLALYTREHSLDRQG